MEVYKYHETRNLLLKLALVLILSLSLTNCKGQEAEQNQTYTYKEGNPNGIGKWYMEREIAHVMGYQGMRFEI